MPVPIGAFGQSRHRAQEIFASEYPSAKLTLERILGNMQPIADIFPMSTIKITSAA